ncbi:MAG: XdhC/CoxI family protein [Bacteroidota bacterium]
MDIYQQIYEIKQNNLECVLCIITDTKGSSPRKAGAKMIVFPDRKIIGTIGGGSIEFQAISDAIELLKNGSPMKKTYQLEEDLEMQCGGSVELYFEPIKSTAELYIFGAGHIGRVLAKYAKDFGFRITLFDEREGIFEEFDTSGVKTICENYFTALEKAVFTENTYSVIVTPKHEYDKRIVGYCAKKTFAYLGMIGSNRKVAEVKKRLLEQNILNAQEIDKIDMPIGIKFNAQTPEEIGISILAKLIDVKNTLNSNPSNDSLGCKAMH